MCVPRDHGLPSLKDCAASFLLEPGEMKFLAVSAELCRQLRRSESELVDKDLEIFQEGLPTYAVSRSAKSKIRAFCEAAGHVELQRNGEVATVQACQRGDQSSFVAYQLFHSFKAAGRPLVLGVQLAMCEGHAPDMKAKLSDLHEEALLQLRAMRPVEVKHHDDAFRFYGVRLQEQSLLLDEGRTCQRREFDVLPRGAQVFGDRPVKPDPAGLRFAVRVGAASKAFSGLPFLGFTRRVPSDRPDLYPDVATNLAMSVLLGGHGEASARDEATHYQSGFKAPPQHEVQTFSSQPELPRHQRRPPAEPEIGDILECRYTWKGRLQMLLNQKMILDFDTGRPIDPTAAYYAVLDVAFGAYRLSLVTPEVLSPTSASFTESTCSGTSQGDDSQDLESLELNWVPRERDRRPMLLACALVTLAALALGRRLR